MFDRTVSHYRITSSLGTGGMGVVYGAQENESAVVRARGKAYNAGFTDPQWTRQDPDLAPLHGDPEFERMYPSS